MVAPDEVGLAPHFAQEYLAGGGARKRLFRPGGSAAGGFGAGDITVILPFVLQAINDTEHVIRLFLNSEIPDLLGTLMALDAIREKCRHRKDVNANPPNEGAQYRAYDALVGSLETGLMEVIPDPGEREGAARRIARSCFEDPDGTREFLDRAED